MQYATLRLTSNPWATLCRLPRAGLGKSLQTITFLHTYYAGAVSGAGGRSPQRALLVVPPNVVGNWVNELNAWLPAKGSPAYHEDGLTVNKVSVQCRSARRFYHCMELDA